MEVVEDVAVIGVDDDKRGEVPRAYIVKKKGDYSLRTPNESSLMSFQVRI